MQDQNGSDSTKPRLHVIRNGNRPDMTYTPEKGRVVRMAEDRVKMYEDMRHKQWRRKFWGNVASVAFMLGLLVTGWFLYCSWQGRQERARQAEEQRQRELVLEQERKDAEKRARMERERLEKERAAAEKKAAEERAAAERKRLEDLKRENQATYNASLMALCRAEFDLFHAGVTNSLPTAGGELCYLLPTEAADVPIYWVAYGTNGTVKVSRYAPDGVVTDMEAAVFFPQLDRLDYLVAKDGRVYFRSTQKKPRIGKLDKTVDADPAETFFGLLTPVLARLKPSYDALNFEILFLPKGYKNPIPCQVLDFGMKYSMSNVREAVEEAIPLRGRKVKAEKPPKFKRTVKIWDGAVIKRGLDGITYVPRTFSLLRPYYDSSVVCRGPGWIRTGSYRRYDRRAAIYDQNKETWERLMKQVEREDAEEKRFYENHSRQVQERTTDEQDAAVVAWRKKIDKIMEKGDLYYRIKKDTLPEALDK